MTNAISSSALKTVKFVIGILLVPCCVAMTITFLDQLAIMGRGGGLMRDWRFLCLALGFIFWLVLYVVMPQPTRVYVFGHEMTHAIWAWLMGARVKNIRASSQGGSVTVSKTNFLITLAPYFFPFYGMAFVIVYLLGDLAFDWERYLPAFCILLGVGWGFHLTFTISTLSRTQTDVTQNGWLFSMTLIYWINVFVLGLMLAIISSHGRVWSFFKILARDHVDVGAWLLRTGNSLFG